MIFSSTLIPGKLVKRYKRFLSDHILDDGNTVTAHVANPGSMLGLDKPGLKTWLSISNNPKRKLKYTWEIVRVKPGKLGLVGINTQHPNKLALESIKTGVIKELSGYPNIRTEVNYGSRNSRIDLLLKNDSGSEAFVEVKNVTLKRRKFAEFPDSVTSRGRKHLLELQELSERGKRAIMLFIVQREDCEAFRVAKDIDPQYFEAFSSAIDSGLEALCYSCTLSGESIKINRKLPVIIE